MSTLVEIQEAVAHLLSHERKALQLWLESQTGPELSLAEEQCLLDSLDEAVREIDGQKGVSIDEVRSRIASWAAR